VQGSSFILNKGIEVRVSI